MSLKALRIVHSPFGGRAMLLEHPRHGLAEVLEAEQDGRYLIRVRRVPEQDRTSKLRALDNAERILQAEAEKPKESSKPPRRWLGKVNRRASGAGA